jgi:hypothetical protein
LSFFGAVLSAELFVFSVGSFCEKSGTDIKFVNSIDAAMSIHFANLFFGVLALVIGNEGCRVVFIVPGFHKLIFKK